LTDVMMEDMTLIDQIVGEIASAQDYVELNALKVSSPACRDRGARLKSIGRIRGFGTT
jgi:hypothetical protein